MAKKKSRGISLIEAIVAIAIFAVSILMATGIFVPIYIEGVRFAQNNTTAIAVARSVMENVKSMSYSSIPVSVTNATYPVSETQTMLYDINSTIGADMIKITVTVRWVEHSNLKTYRVTSIKAKDL